MLSIQAICVLAAGLNKGVISDDLRIGAFQTCGEVADAMLLYLWVVLSSREQGSPVQLAES